MQYAVRHHADQDFGADPVTVRESDHYHFEYVEGFVDKWDELIDWDRRAKSERDFFCERLRERGARRILDVATGTGFHSIRLIEAGFEVVSADGSPTMLVKAQENARARGVEMTPVHADWRHLGQEVKGLFDAIICLGNSFTHLFSEDDRRRALAEFKSLLRPRGALIIDQRNYDAILDNHYRNNHIFYCGQKVRVEPEYVDSGLARFRYAFPDHSVYHLNMYPLRQDYLLGLLAEAGFDRVTTYGDLQAEYDPAQAEFFVHVAESSGAAAAPGEGAGQTGPS